MHADQPVERLQRRVQRQPPGRRGQGGLRAGVEPGRGPIRHRAAIPPRHLDRCSGTGNHADAAVRHERKQGALSRRRDSPPGRCGRSAELVARQGGQPEHPLGALGRDEQRPGVCDERGVVELVPVPQHHPGGHPLTPPFVRNPRYRGFRHGRMTLERDLDLTRVHVQAA